VVHIVREGFVKCLIVQVLELVVPGVSVGKKRSAYRELRVDRESMPAGSAQPDPV